MVCIAHSCRGLSVANEWNLVHCDIKPENILIHEGGILKIADFGVSTILKNGDDAKRSAGTFLYMSPEALDGKISHKSDIWSLGATIHEVCTLAPTF